MSKRPTVVAFAVVSVLLLVIAPGAQALNTNMQSTERVVGSQHDTQTEFDNAQELTNLTTTSSGDGAAALETTTGGTVSDGFEDGTLNGWGGTIDEFSIATSPTSEGSYAVSHDGSGGDKWESIYHNDTSNAASVSADVQTSYTSGDPATGVVLHRQAGSRQSYFFTVDPVDNEWEIRRIDGYASTTTIATSTENAPSTDTWYRLELERSGDELVATAYSDSGTELTQFSVTDTTYTSGYAGLGGFGDRTATYDDFTASYAVSYIPDTARYVSDVHSVSGAEQAAINITEFSNVSVEATVRTDGGTVLNQTTLDDTGNHTLTLADSSSDQLETVLDVTVTGEQPALELSDESILFTNHKPQAANFDPPDGGQLTQRSVDFSVDVSDPEFPTAQGDSVEARLFVDDQQVGSETVTSNQTVSITHTIETGGSHEYYWELEDSYGSVTTTATKTVSAPGEISVYNSSAPTQLVDNAEVEIRVYANETSDAPEVYTRNTTDGTLNMSGLPADKPFVVVADAENYTTRRIFVPSLYETQSIYLLPDSEEAVSTEFQLEDYTGNYPGENSVLLVQRALNGSYQTVLGDFFGANDQFPAQLEYNVRHRLVIMNVETGQQRVVGTYTPQSPTAQTIAITPSGITSFEEQPASITVQPTTNRLPAVSDANLSVTLDNNSATIDSWNVTAVAANGSTSTTLWTYATQEPGTATQTVDLTGRSQETLLVNVTYVVDGATLTETARISIDEVYDNDATLLATLTQLADLSAPGTRAEFTGFLSMLVTVFAVAATARIQPSSVISGFTGVMVVAGFSAIGWVGYDVVFVAAVGFVGFTAIERGL